MKLDAYIIPDVGMNSEAIPMGSKNGFISKNGWRNPIVKIGDYTLRERSELLLIKEDKILIQKKDDWETGDYKIPGGGTDEFLSVVDTAIKECKEEALIVPTNVKYYGAYTIIFKGDDPIPKWLKNDNNGKFPKGIYQGYYTHVSCGLYKEPYTGKVADEDKDSFYQKAKWIPIEEAKKFLKPEHKKALAQYLLLIRH